MEEAGTEGRAVERCRPGAKGDHGATVVVEVVVVLRSVQ